MIEPVEQQRCDNLVAGRLWSQITASVYKSLRKYFSIMKSSLSALLLRWHSDLRRSEIEGGIEPNLLDNIPFGKCIENH